MRRTLTAHRAPCLMDVAQPGPKPDRIRTTPGGAIPKLLLVPTHEDHMKNLTRFMALATLTALAGCASAPREVAARIDFTPYHRAIAVDAVQLAPGVAADLSRDERNALASKLRVALVGALSERATISEAAPGVLRLAVTVTGIDTTSPTVNAISSALLFVPVDRGGIAFEARFFDGQEAQPFASSTELHKGSPLDIKGNFSHYGHAISALARWAEGLAHELEQT